MRRPRPCSCAFAYLLTLLACGDDTSPVDAGTDARADSAADAAPDVPIASDGGRDVDFVDIADTGRPDTRVRDVGPDAPRGHTPRMRVFDDTPCEPWEPVESPLSRELPSNTTPRTLWAYQPSLDPSYEPINARFESRVGSPVVSPDGTIWVKGPGYDLISQLNRDGTMREWFAVGGAENEDAKDTQRLGNLSVAPNGFVFAIIYTEDPAQPGYLVWIDPDSEVPHDPPTTTSPAGLELDVNSRLAISPDGMVYAISQNRVYGLCRGERLMWTLTNSAAAGERDFYNTGYFGGVFVQADSSLLVSGSFAETYEVTAGGDLTAQLMFPAADRTFYRSVAAVRLDRLMLQAYDPSSESGTRFDVGVRVGPSDWRRQRTTSFPFAMNALGELVLRRSDGVPYRWEPVDDVRTPVSTDIILGQGDARLEDGGWLTVTSRDGIEGLYSLDVAGDTRWVFDPVEEGDRALVLGGNERILDDQGVYYRTVSVGGQFIQLVAVQTDVLPPPNTMCLDYYGCNAQRDRYLRPE